MYGSSDGIASELELLNDSERHEGQSEWRRKRSSLKYMHII